ncbi:MAG: transcription-repair coupling factor [Buchnera aphidicola (Periphyllus lyropictus)]|uniref:transcription-repair coupling factor n=1 Tax=Buchnera aphidicola TaxID=9 RepID=UPI001EC56ABA|nr:transcription-repair coupling factor [Buchnera aphidicola]NIH16603.1 transcription-repair coupling factor [Buchnera aphidicola (Periphyllus lyropictus)]USS94516.1 transcription-repair coupling factor [Buchnera aphidicola (Periphyllus lyropictus)]
MKNTNFKLFKKNSFNININQLVIHIKHGIGRYIGLKTIETHGIKSEYLIILYADNDKLYVPISSLNLIKICTNITNKISLHKLGSENWKKEKKNISKKVFDTAAILLKTYANRSSKKGFIFKKNNKKYFKFCKTFPFKTTPDQSKVINSVLDDMCSEKPMDRLVCGDVGFGKTEVAMRAAFLAFCNKKQVAILVPTTLLAQQHYNNFISRFKNYSISIEMLSSFKTKKEQNLILKNIKNGKINIIISTHKIIFNDIKWKNLGLLIIDEEHRFGVYHKEFIKKSFNNIDILVLTATPIPRTLNMSLLGIRDLSIINTPPEKRLLVKTFVKQKNKKIIRRAILKEIKRGGKVYYVYNKIKKIKKKLNYLKKLVPEGNFKIGHGQMKKKKLKKIMNNFYNNNFNILLCTTIIENGLDIPLANTIIIENSDHFGLSQLHQLRGRVGRSYYQAYAFLLVSNIKKITENSKKRLKSISSIEDFSAGFSLAKNDLEIRGMGEILGTKQSGYIKNIGLDLYTKLLKKAIKTLKKGNKKSIKNLLSNNTKIEFDVPALLPDNYILNVNKRLFFYLKLSSIKTINELKLIKRKLINSFGNLPKLAKNLILVTKIKILSKNFEIKKIKFNTEGGIIKFFYPNKINTIWLIKFLKKKYKNWKLKNKNSLFFFKKFNNKTDKIKWIIKFILTIKKNDKKI